MPNATEKATESAAASASRQKAQQQSLEGPSEGDAARSRLPDLLDHLESGEASRVVVVDAGPSALEHHVRPGRVTRSSDPLQS